MLDGLHLGLRHVAHARELDEPRELGHVRVRPEARQALGLVLEQEIPDELLLPPVAWT